MGFQSFPDPVAYEVGKRTDAADAAGSLHAKVSDVRNNLDYFRDKTPRFVSAACPADETTTVLNVTGSGYLTGIAVTTYRATCRLKVTMDGVVLLDSIEAAHNFIYPYYGGANSISALHRFNTNLVIEVYSAAHDSYAFVSYLLD